MAARATDLYPQSRLRELLEVRAPAPGRLAFALRLALICALTTVVVEFYQTPSMAVTVYLAFFINRVDRMSSLLINFVLLLMMTIVIGLVILVTTQVIDQPGWRVASMAALSFGLLFLTSASKLRPLGSSIALVVGYGLDLLGTAAGGEIAVRGLLYAWLFVGIPTLVSLVVTLLFAQPPRRLVEQALAQRLRICAAMLCATNPSTVAAFKVCLQEGLGEIPAWLKLAGMERTSPAAVIAALHTAAESTLALLLLMDLATDAPPAALPAAVKERIGALLAQMASILEAGGYPIDIELEESTQEAGLPPVAAALVADVRTALQGFAQATVPQGSPAPPATPAKGGFMLPDAFSNPEHVQFAVKTTAAAMFCYGLYSLLDWPAIHTCFLTCYIVALSTTAEAIEKLTLRIVGCLLGAGAGIAAIVYVMPSLDSIGLLMAVVFCGAFVAAWVAGGSARISYVGLQIGFAFFLCVIQGPAPTFDMTIARDRVIGILIGILVAYSVFVYVWPVSVAKRIDPAIGKLLRTLADLVLSAGLSTRRTLATAALAARGAIARDIGLLGFEPQWLRPSDAWTQERSRILGEIDALIGPLMLATDRSPQLISRMERRIAQLAGKWAPRSAPQTEPPAILPHGREFAAQETATALWRLVDSRLLSLEHTIDADLHTERTASHGPA